MRMRSSFVLFLRRQVISPMLVFKPLYLPSPARAPEILSKNGIPPLPNPSTTQNKSNPRPSPPIFRIASHCRHRGDALSVSAGGVLSFPPFEVIQRFGGETCADGRQIPGSDKPPPCPCFKKTRKKKFAARRHAQALRGWMQLVEVEEARDVLAEPLKGGRDDASTASLRGLL